MRSEARFWIIGITLVAILIFIFLRYVKIALAVLLVLALIYVVMRLIYGKKVAGK